MEELTFSDALIIIFFGHYQPLLFFSQAWPDPCVYVGSGPQHILNLCQLQKFCSREEVMS